MLRIDFWFEERFPSQSKIFQKFRDLRSWIFQPPQTSFGVHGAGAFCRLGFSLVYPVWGGASQAGNLASQAGNLARLGNEGPVVPEITLLSSLLFHRTHFSSRPAADTLGLRRLRKSTLLTMSSGRERRNGGNTYYFGGAMRERGTGGAGGEGRNGPGGDGGLGTGASLSVDARARHLNMSTHLHFNNRIAQGKRTNMDLITEIVTAAKSQPHQDLLEQPSQMHKFP
ncbi:hypothetical protein B0H13DRAFT_1861659 [Mycena leptocephala]|nr:hypothetical protein B0H13DRAFT_1861659 [Mycena leptocephala]